LKAGVLGGTLVGLAFILPSFLMVVAVSLAYVAYGGLWWMQALFYAIGATVIATIAIAAYKLARSTNKRDPLLWAIFIALTAVTLWAQAELAEFFILPGLVVLFVHAWPGWKSGSLMALTGAVLGSAIWFFEAWVRQAGTAASSQGILTQILLFFTKSGALCSAAGLPSYLFFNKGWFSNLAGSIRSAFSCPFICLRPFPAPWFKRHRDNAQLKAFVDGATAAATGATPARFSYSERVQS
jgi:chromate transporter